MKWNFRYLLILCVAVELLASCSTLEKASVHGLTSGYYTWKSESHTPRNVYVDVTAEKIEVYGLTGGQPDHTQLLTVPLTTTDTPLRETLTFKKQGLDVDITSILLKYRPGVHGLPAQIHTDLNLALYAGWRYDTYQVKGRKDPLGRNIKKLSARGYDFGVFAGPGTTAINPVTTLNRRTDEYNGIILQAGIAGFLELNIASFGLSVGYDYLLNPDRRIWIYRNKPWVGFIVGIALH